MRVGVDAAGHAEEQRVPLLAVVAEDLRRQAEGDTRHLGEPFVGRVAGVLALLAEPDRVEIGVELDVG